MGFDKFDEDSNGRLNHHEWMKMSKAHMGMMKEALGDAMPHYTRGQMEFFWTMSSSVQNGSWNRWGHHGEGISKKDSRRLVRIMRKVYTRMVEDYMEEESDSDSDDEDATEE